MSVKPHASPVLHALEYLLGELDAAYLTTLREFGGLQSYPSRLKDPVPADYSTGSVGIGATAPIWGALARRYVNTLLGAGGTGRQWSLVGDAELDEGAVWEAVLDPMVAELGEVVWVVDLNRQSLDRVVPTMGATRLQGMFAAAGWQVLTVKYGRLLEELFARAGRRRRCATASTRCPTPSTSGCCAARRPSCATVLPGDGPAAADIARADRRRARTTTCSAAVRNLGGHDLAALREAFAQIDDTRPTVIIAYTLKGYGLAIEGHPQNHSALLTEAQLARARRPARHRPRRPVGAASPADSRRRPAARRRPPRGCAARRCRRRPAPAVPGRPRPHPARHGDHPGRARAARCSTSTAPRPRWATRVVTVSPDVSSSRPTSAAG